MKKFLLLPCIFLMTTGCNFSSTNTSVIDIANEVQSITSEACQFLPTVKSIADIVAANNAALATANQIAVAICAEVKKPGASLESNPAYTVGGVKVLGFRVVPKP
jgi:hypothetical protein